jgi:UDP-N-acetylmuramoyl-tripeptide--D-alanyl-D-alanine ligase
MTTPELHSLFLNSNGVQTDTRALQPGQLYFALRGDRFDGHNYAEAAMAQGALAVVVDREDWSDQSGYIVVPDVLTALQDLARHHRIAWGKRVVGLTGSNGKTTAKELFARVASRKYNVLATVGNLNNHIGVPLTLLQLKPEHELAVVEMGANHQREIYALAGMCLPNLGYITNYGKAHLEGFGGVEGVIKGKSELYDRLREWNGTALVNTNDAEQMRRTEGLELWTFGNDTRAKTPYAILPADEQGFAQIECSGIRVHTHLTGAFQATNIAAAMALANWLDIPATEAASAINSYVPNNNRAEWRTTDRNRVLLDAYNANPSSTLASLQAFAQLQNVQNPLVVLGDMFELGEWAAAEHQAILDWVHTNAPHWSVWTVGPLYAACQRPVKRSFVTTEEALNELTTNVLNGATVLIKGSRGMALEQLLPAL